MTMHVIFALAAVAIFGISTAGAQTERTYVGATGMLSAQDSHRQSAAPSLPTTGAEGTAIGVTAEAGALLTPRLALGIEISFPHRFRSVAGDRSPARFSRRAATVTRRSRGCSVRSPFRGMACSSESWEAAGTLRKVRASGGAIKEDRCRRSRPCSDPKRKSIPSPDGRLPHSSAQMWKSQFPLAWRSCRRCASTSFGGATILHKPGWALGLSSSSCVQRWIVRGVF